jgi:hypothetical protein
MTGGRVAATTGAAIGATEEIVATGGVTGDAGALSVADMLLTAAIISGTRRSAVRSSFPKC